jgi:hypothetical protein
LAAGKMSRPRIVTVLSCYELFFPPKPFAVRLSPIRVTLLILADQDAETNASAPVALFAQLVKSNQFSLGAALSLNPRRDCGNGNQYCGDAGGREYRISSYLHIHLHLSISASYHISPAQQLPSAT